MADFKNQKIKIKTNFDHSLGFIKLVLTSLLVLLVFTLNFSKHGCNGGEEDETSFALRITHVLYMLVKHVVDFQALFLQGEWEKFAILSNL